MALRVRADFSGNPLRLPILHATVRQQNRHHDLVILTVPNDRGHRQRYRSGRRMYVEYGYAPWNLESFFGYVNHTKEHHHNGRHYLDIYGIGASWHMKGRALRTWHGVTATHVARQLAHHHRLNAKIDPHKRIFRTLAQKGMSDWEFLAQLAERIGYSFYVNKTTMYFVNPLLHERRTTYPTFRKDREVIEFHPHLGEIAPDIDYVSREIYTVDPRQQAVVGGKVHPVVAWSEAEDRYANNDPYQDCGPIGMRIRPTFSAPIPDVPTESVGEFKAVLEEASRTNRYLVRAKMRTSGNPRVHQGSSIALLGYDRKYDGMWHVDYVEHDFSFGRRGSYTMEMHAGRDRLYTVKRYPTQDRAPGLPSSTHSPVTTIVGGGRWQSVATEAPGCG